MISSSQEDYIEFIYNFLKEDKELRAIDIANHFKVARPTVTEALIKLADNDLIIYEGRRGIKITPKGIDTATKINNKHKILFDFLVHVLQVDEKIANENACRIEHVIDDSVIEKMKIFSQKY